MTSKLRPFLLFAAVAICYIVVGISQSWPLALTILNNGLIVAIMALGVNIQWGYAGLFNIGVAGFFGLGGLAVVLVSKPFDQGAWAAGTPRILLALLAFAAAAYFAVRLHRGMAPGSARKIAVLAALVCGFFTFSYLYGPAVDAVEAITPASTGNIGGMGLPVLLSLLVGGVFAAGAAWAVAKIALGLRSDYLAIATLGIGQIIIAVLMNEDWLDRGVKNITDIGRWPVPDEVALQQQQWFGSLTHAVGMDLRTGSTVFVGVCFAALFTVVLVILLTLAELSLKSPWGRMMRAIRDNENAAEAMGKDVKRRHLQIFVLGSTVIGIAGALYVMLHGLMAPQSYNDPLRYTFLIWAMVILGGSGNNFGAVLGALIIMLLWAEAESVGPALLALVAEPMAGGALKQHLIDSAVQMRLPLVGIVLLLVLRFSPKGLIPEK
jgi:branched-chain amino acid transport system permease protein